LIKNLQELQQAIENAAVNVRPETLTKVLLLQLLQKSSMLFAGTWTSFRIFSLIAYFYMFVNMYSFLFPN
jgi:hypothetical protein